MAGLAGFACLAGLAGFACFAGLAGFSGLVGFGCLAGLAAVPPPPPFLPPLPPFFGFGAAASSALPPLPLFLTLCVLSTALPPDLGAAVDLASAFEPALTFDFGLAFGFDLGSTAAAAAGSTITGAETGLLAAAAASASWGRRSSWTPTKVLPVPRAVRAAGCGTVTLGLGCTASFLRFPALRGCALARVMPFTLLRSRGASCEARSAPILT
ncbi:MAG: hypothetical protein E6Q90_10815, partial [Actinobacteria bacterium]